MRHRRRHQGRLNGASGGPPRRLSTNLVDRLAAARSGGTAPKLPVWSRSVRLGVDYAVRLAIPDRDASAEACDSWAWACMVLGNAAAADKERGDPPATCEAREVAHRAGPDHARAFELLDQVRDGSDAWAARGWATPALPAASMAILQRAARGERVKASDDLEGVLAGAQALASQLAYPLLREPTPP